MLPCNLFPGLHGVAIELQVLGAAPSNCGNRFCSTLGKRTGMMLPARTPQHHDFEARHTQRDLCGVLEQDRDRLWFKVAVEVPGCKDNRLEIFPRPT